MTLVYLILLVSLALNILVIWYAVRLLLKYFPMSEDIEDLFESLNQYHFHIKTVSEMESFYGDDILLNLLKHSKAITDEVDKFRGAYSLLDDTEEETLDGGETEDDDESKNEDDTSKEA